MNYRKYIEAVIQLENTNYFSEGNKRKDTKLMNCTSNT